MAKHAADEPNLATILDNLVKDSASAIIDGDMDASAGCAMAQFEELDLADVALLAYTAILRLAANEVKARIFAEALEGAQSDR